MTVIQYFPRLENYEYRVWEKTNCGVKVRYCSLEEVLYILSTKEGEEDD